MDDTIKRTDALKAVETEHYSGSIEVIERNYYTDPHSSTTDFEETLLSIFHKIEDIPSAEPTVDKDYLINLIQEAVYDGEACKRLLDLVEPKQGEWIPNSPYTGLCSECGGDGNLKNNFCPNCGNPNTEEAMRILASRYHNCDARMKGADDDAD